MQRAIYFLISWMLAIFSASAQTDKHLSVIQSEVKGLIEVKTAGITEIDNTILVEMDILILKEAMNKRQSWSIRPVMIGDNEESLYDLPYLLINGRMKQKHFKRRIRFGNKKLINDFPHIRIDSPLQNDTTVHYKFSIPAESWMNNANLYLYQMLASSAGKKQYFVHPIGNTKSPEINEITAFYTENHANNEQLNIENQIELSFFYETNLSGIESGWSINPFELSKLRRTLADLLTKPEINICNIEICGYASPDGPVDKNQKLAEKRALQLKEYLRQNFDLPENQIQTRSIAEDWDKLREMITEVDFINKEQLYSIIDSSMDPETKEQRLKKLPHSWDSIRETLLPLLRRVDLKITYSTTKF